MTWLSLTTKSIKKSSPTEWGGYRTKLDYYYNNEKLQPIGRMNYISSDKSEQLGPVCFRVNLSNTSRIVTNEGYVLEPDDYCAGMYLNPPTFSNYRDGYVYYCASLNKVISRYEKNGIIKGNFSTEYDEYSDNLKNLVNFD